MESLPDELPESESKVEVQQPENLFDWLEDERAVDQVSLIVIVYIFVFVVFCFCVLFLKNVIVVF